MVIGFYENNGLISGVGLNPKRRNSNRNLGISIDRNLKAKRTGEPAYSRCGESKGLSMVRSDPISKGSEWTYSSTKYVHYSYKQCLSNVESRYTL